MGMSGLTLLGSVLNGILPFVLSLESGSDSARIDPRLSAPVFKQTVIHAIISMVYLSIEILHLKLHFLFKFSSLEIFQFLFLAQLK